MFGHFTTLCLKEIKYISRRIFWTKIFLNLSFNECKNETKIKNHWYWKNFLSLLVFKFKLRNWRFPWNFPLTLDLYVYMCVCLSVCLSVFMYAYILACMYLHAAIKSKTKLQIKFHPWEFPFLFTRHIRMNTEMINDNKPSNHRWKG